MLLVISPEISAKGVVCPKLGGRDMRNRQKQRELRKAQRKEAMIDKRNSCGVKDLTAYNALLQIRTNGKANIVLR